MSFTGRHPKSAVGLFDHVSTLAEKTSGQSTVARARSSSRRRRFARASKSAHRGGVVRPPASGARACLPPPPPVARRFGYQKRSTLPGRSRAFSRCGAAMVKYCIVVHLPCTAEEYMILKDDPEYVRYQLGEVGARELSRVSELGADGFVTQTIVNRPNIAVPARGRRCCGARRSSSRTCGGTGTGRTPRCRSRWSSRCSTASRTGSSRGREYESRTSASTPDGAVRRDDATYRKKKKRRRRRRRGGIRRTKTKTRRTLLFRPRRASLSASLWAFSARRRARFGASAR